jgi:hypothetical protein
MSFNLSKCKVMHIGLHNPCYEYFLRREKLGETKEERDIGVIVTRNLKPSNPVLQSSRKSNGSAPSAAQKLSLPIETDLHS